MKAGYYLNGDELRLALAVMSGAEPGRARLIDAFKEFWDFVTDKRGYGRRFKRSAEAGFIPGVEVSTKTITNHQTYIIKKRRNR